jgi:hypothetical protein
MLGDNAFLLEQLGFGTLDHCSDLRLYFGRSGRLLCKLRGWYCFSLNLRRLCVHADCVPLGAKIGKTSVQCPVGDTNVLFPVLDGNKTVSRRSKLVRRWW